jgi:hemin uptake protein HemP
MKEKPMEATVRSEETRAMGEVIPTRSAQELLGERGILRIEHEGELYTLRITRNNRLILTK